MTCVAKKEGERVQIEAELVLKCEFSLTEDFRKEFIYDLTFDDVNNVIVNDILIMNLHEK